MKTVDIKGKAYVPVNERVKYFRENEAYQGWSMVTVMITDSDGKVPAGEVTMRAEIADTTGRIIATGFAHEKESDGYINKTSHIENCETSAWGRALANLGIGIDAEVASADELAQALHQQKEPAKQKPANPAPQKSKVKGDKEAFLLRLVELAEKAKFPLRGDGGGWLPEVKPIVVAILAKMGLEPDDYGNASKEIAGWREDEFMAVAGGVMEAEAANATS